jgi:mRNA interferase RelE/StbE
VPEYRVTMKASAEKEFIGLPDSVTGRILPKIKALAMDPLPHGSIKLKGSRDSWRVRVGSYRVIYMVDDEAKKVYVTRIAHRREVYDI